MKKKLNLKADELRVDSFDTDTGADGRGTVHGKDGSDCVTYSCEGTCGASPPSDSYARVLAKPTYADFTLCIACCA